MRENLRKGWCGYKSEVYVKLFPFCILVAQCRLHDAMLFSRWFRSDSSDFEIMVLR
jgi:hypothetical protein